MMLEDLRSMLEAQPFEPFRLRLPDGRALDVPHPEFVALPPGRRGRAVFVWRPDGITGWRVDLSLVSDFEPLAGARKKKRSNGG